MSIKAKYNNVLLIIPICIDWAEDNVEILQEGYNECVESYPFCFNMHVWQCSSSLDGNILCSPFIGHFTNVS